MLFTYILSIAVGVMLEDGRMVGATECEHCTLKGTVADIALHEVCASMVSSLIAA